MAEVRYVIIIKSAFFGGRRGAQSYAFTCPPGPRRRHTLLVAVAEFEAEAEAEAEVEA